MYFENRSQAGQFLAAQLYEHYRYDNCVVLALNDAAVLVGEQVAARLHCILTLLVTEDIHVPGEGMSIGAVSQGGDFTYNSDYTEGEITEFTSEFHGYFEEQRRVAFSKINRLIAEGGVSDRELLQDHVIILVSDGFDSGASISVALEYLKPIRVRRVVAAAPVATIPAVDRLHVAVDEMHILDVKENYLGKDHYYEDNTIPDHTEIVAKINEIILNWR